MPLATKNGSLIVKDGKLAEGCDCCGGWYCDLDPTADPAVPCCSAQSLLLTMNFTVSPQLGSPVPGQPAQSEFAARFPMSVSSSVSLPLSTQNPGVTQYFSETGYNSLGFNEAIFWGGVSISAGSCNCTVRITHLFFYWKWDTQAVNFSPGDASREPDGFNYAEFVLCRPDFANSPAFEFAFVKGQSPCFPSTTLSVTGKSIPGRGSASGSVTISTG